MIPYLGDFAEDATVYHYFNTFDSNDPANSVTITNLADSDIYVYKDGSVTDIVTDGASVVIDFDARTGVHKLTVDTSVHADYAIGSDYMVLIEGTTVDAGTVTAAIFTFSIENRYNAAADDLANGTDGLGALKTLIDAIQTDLDNGTDGLGAIKGDTAAILVDTADIQPNYATSASIAALNDVAATDIVSAGAITTSGGAVTTVTNVGTVTGNVDGSVASVTGAVGSVTGAVGSVTGHTNQTGDSFAIVNGAAGLVAIDTVVDAIKVVTDAIGATGTGLSAIPWNASWDAEVESEVNDALDTAISELGVAAPTATPTLRTGLMLLYMALRNKLVVQTSGTDAIELYNNAGTKIAAKTITDNGTDYIEDEMA